MHATSGSWNVDANGDWNVNGNWSGATFPDGAAQEATFGSTITANRIVSVPTAVTVRQVNFDNGFDYDLSSTGGSVTFDIDSGVSPQINVTNSNGDGSHTFGVPIVITDEVGTFTISNSSTGTFTMSNQISSSGSSGITSLIISGPETVEFTGTAGNSYIGTTILSGGTLIFSKTASAKAVSGPITISGGTLQLDASDQFGGLSSSVDMQINSGTFDMNSNPDFIQSLTFNSGTITQASSELLTINGTGSEVLVMRGTTITGPIKLSGSSGGGVRFDGASGGTATIMNDLDLGIATRTFNIDQAAAEPDMLLSGVIKENGVSVGINKIGAGTLEIGGTSSNTFTGVTTVSAGMLELTKSSATAVSGNLNISNSAIVKVDSSGQFGGASSSSGVMISNTAIFDLTAVASETIGSLVFNGGTLLQATGGTLNLATSSQAALTMRNTTIDQKIALTGGLFTGVSVVFDATNNGTANIAEVDLGGSDRMFSIANGSATDDMIVSAGSTSGGGLSKTGPGTLRLDGMHDYSGTTTQILQGVLKINGTFTSDMIEVTNGATLKGTGTITADMNFDGTVSPGASIGTTVVVGDVTFSPISTFEVEHNVLTSDLLDVTGSVTIDPGASLLVITEPGMYPLRSSYTIMTTTGGITGNFTNIGGSGAVFTYSVSKSGGDLLLNVTRRPLDVIVTSPNAKAVAKCLNELTLEPNSDLENILVTLECSCVETEINSFILQLQPSHLKGFAISQENNTFKVRNVIHQRTREIYRRVCAEQPLKESKLSVWGDIFGDFYQQDKLGEEIAFRSKTAAAVAGVDYQGIENFLVGFAGTYSYSDLKWRENRGNGDINSIYGTLYGTYFQEDYFINGALIGAFNHYNEKRYIKSSFLNRQAQGNFNGGEVMAHVDGAYICKKDNYELKPFLSLDYIYLYQQSFEETGAEGLNLDVYSADYGMFRSELGVNGSTCISKPKNKLLIDAKLSWIREERFFGANYEAKFKGTDCTYKVKGMNPDRSLFSPGITGTYLSQDGDFVVSVGYEAEIGGHSLNQNVSGQAVFKF